MYKASKLVSNENQLMTLDQNERHTFDIIEGTSSFVRIPIQGKVPPVRVAFEYGEGMTKKNDLTVCFSRRVKQPVLVSCEKLFHRPGHATLESVDPYYLQQYLYIGLHSDQGCLVTLRVTFPKEDMNPYARSGTAGGGRTEFEGIDRRSKSQNRQIMRFRAEVEKKIKDIGDDQTLIDLHNQELEELRQMNNERMNCKSRDEQHDHVRQNKLIASEWHHV